MNYKLDHIIIMTFGEMIARCKDLIATKKLCIKSKKVFSDPLGINPTGFENVLGYAMAHPMNYDVLSDSHVVMDDIRFRSKRVFMPYRIGLAWRSTRTVLADRLECAKY